MITREYQFKSEADAEAFEDEILDMEFDVEVDLDSCNAVLTGDDTDEIDESHDVAFEYNACFIR